MLGQAKAYEKFNLIKGGTGAFLGSKYSPWQAEKMFIEKFGSTIVDALDNSLYEGANIVQDLNQVLSDDNLKNKYNTIIDGGTLEHVFDIATALRISITRVPKVVVSFTWFLPTTVVVMDFISFLRNYFIDCIPKKMDLSQQLCVSLT